MRSLFIAMALGLFAVLAFAGTLTEPETTSALATASFPNADPVIVNLDTKAPFPSARRDSRVIAPPQRAFTDL